MEFVKLDRNIVRSTLWWDKASRDVFITAILLAGPCEFTEPAPQLQVGALTETGFVLPPGWYGFAPASGPGISYIAGVEKSVGIEALRKMREPDAESRSQDFGGRRLIRVARRVLRS